MARVYFPYCVLPAGYTARSVRWHDASVHASFSDIFSHFSFALMAAWTSLRPLRDAARFYVDKALRR